MPEMPEMPENAPIGADEYAKRIAELCARNGRHPFPRRTRDRAILLHALAQSLTQAGSARSSLPERFGALLSSEREVTERIGSWLLGAGRVFDVDPVSLRRALVDEGFLTRESGGKNYAPSDDYEARFTFEPAVLDVDPDAVIAEAQSAAAERKARSRKQP